MIWVTLYLSIKAKLLVLNCELTIFINALVSGWSGSNLFDATICQRTLIIDALKLFSILTTLFLASRNLSIRVSTSWTMTESRAFRPNPKSLKNYVKSVTYDFRRSINFTEFFKNVVKSSYCLMHSVKITEFYWHHFVAKIPWKYFFTIQLNSKLIWRKRLHCITGFSAHCRVYEIFVSLKNYFVKSIV